jgi:hypothetical protein
MANVQYQSKHNIVTKRFLIHDSMGVKRLKKLADVETGIVTGELLISWAFQFFIYCLA